MFTGYTLMKGSLFTQSVNTLVGSIFLGVCALWAALFILNVTTGSNPIDRAIAKMVLQSTLNY